VYREIELAKCGINQKGFLKGIVQREMVFWLNPTQSSKDTKKNSCWTIINRDMLSFVSLGVLGEFANLIAPSPCTH
jgi:hypothetical protein